MAVSSSAESKMYTASYSRDNAAILPLVVSATRGLPTQAEGQGETPCDVSKAWNSP